MPLTSLSISYVVGVTISKILQHVHKLYNIILNTHFTIRLRTLFPFRKIASHIKETGKKQLQNTAVHLNRRNIEKHREQMFE